MANLEHLRARNAATRLANRFDHCNGSDLRTSLKGYRTVALSAPVELRAVGLLQLAAFYMSKRDKKLEVLQDLLLWLKDAPNTGSFLNPLLPGLISDMTAQNNPTTHAVFAMLSALDSQVIALLEAEGEEYLGWLKRLTEGRWKELPPPPGGNGTAHPEALQGVPEEALEQG